MDIVDRAIIFAVKAHSGAVRKGTNLPYIVHPIESCAIAASITDDKEIIAAAVLHDALEDSEFTKKDLLKEFGERITDLVCSDTEDKMRDISVDKSWKLRKQATLDFLDNATKEEQIICIADKLSNLRAIHRDCVALGEKFWQRFNNRDSKKHAWYYSGIADRLTCLKNTEAYKEYEGLLEKTFTKYYAYKDEQKKNTYCVIKIDARNKNWYINDKGEWEEEWLYDYGYVRSLLREKFDRLVELKSEEIKEFIVNHNIDY